jgi:hypothetical protein
MKSRSVACVVGLVVALAGCGDNGADSSPETVVSVETVPDTAASAGESTASTPAAPTTSIDDGITRINVTVGVDSGPDRVEELTIGESVELTIVNPDADDEFHVHGFDLGGDETPAGEQKVFAFTATEAGDFEVESHVTGEVLVVIRVS